MYRAIIIDDEQIGINALKTLIDKQNHEVKIVASSVDPKKGLELIEDYKPDILFLDVNMPKMNGFDVLDASQYKDFKLVFTTAHPSYALRAIKNRAYDYLLKPINTDELKTCLNRITKELSTLHTSKQNVGSHIIELSVRDGIIFIKPQDIIRLEASGSYTTFYLVNNVKHLASKNLKECESLLEDDYFYRCHPSHIVNLHKVVKMVCSEGLYALMADGSKSDITRKNKEAFLERLKKV